MEIKTAEEILNKWYKPLSKIGDIASIQLTEAMKEYAKQFIDLAEEEADVIFYDADNPDEEYEDIYQSVLYASNANAKVDKESIFKIKQLIK